MKEARILLFLLFMGVSLQGSSENRYIIILENEVLHIVDGNPLAINGTTIGMMLHLRSELGKRRTGNKQADGTFIGVYQFNGKHYTLVALIELEERLVNNPTVAHLKLLEELRNYLDAYIKEEFIKLVEPFLADARGAKGQMIALITEWSIKAQRTETRLLSWAHTTEGHETQAIRERIKTVKDFDQFCVDLVHFLESLMRSCPKACGQYKLIVEKQKEKQQHHK